MRIHRRIESGGWGKVLSHSSLVPIDGDDDVHGVVVVVAFGNETESEIGLGLCIRASGGKMEIGRNEDLDDAVGGVVVPNGYWWCSVHSHRLRRHRVEER